MNRALDFLAPLGILVIAGAFIWERAGQTLPGEFHFFLIGGAALILAHLLVRWDDLAVAIGARQLRYGGNAFVYSLMVLAILAGLNYVTVRNNKRWDLTEGQRHSLSDQTRKVVAGLQEDVQITYFDRSVAMISGQPRLEQYQALSPRIKVDYVDPLKNPAKARSFDALGPYPTVIVERGEKRERLSSTSEQDLTNAIIKVFKEGEKRICFVEGQGESDSADGGERGFRSASDALERNQYGTQKVLLLREKQVPEECTVLVVAGPQNDLLEPVTDAIREFVAGGGKVFVMIEPELDGQTPNLLALLREWNLELRSDVVVDVSGVGSLFGTGALTPIVASYPYHEITKDFRVMTAFHTARSVKAGSETVAGVTAQNLLETSANSWSETDLTLEEPIEAGENDPLGPISLGASVRVKQVVADDPVDADASVVEGDAGADGVAEQADADPADPAGSDADAEEEEKPDLPDGRVVVIGDVDFATNALLSFQGNQDLFLNTIAWLAEDEDQISIRPKEPSDQRLFLNHVQQQNSALLALILIPGFFIVAGVRSWWRRR